MCFENDFKIMHSINTIIMRGSQLLILLLLSKNLRRQQKCWHIVPQPGGRCLFMGKLIESLWWCWLLACCALLDSHFLTNLTRVAFCYLARTPRSGRVDYSSNVKKGYCPPSLLKRSWKLSDNEPFSLLWILAK